MHRRCSIAVYGIIYPIDLSLRITDRALLYRSGFNSMLKCEGAGIFSQFVKNSFRGDAFITQVQRTIKLRELHIKQVFHVQHLFAWLRMQVFLDISVFRVDESKRVYRIKGAVFFFRVIDPEISTWLWCIVGTAPAGTECYSNKDQQANFSH